MRKLKINIESLSKNFGEKKVLNKLNLKIYESESLATAMSFAASLSKISSSLMSCFRDNVGLKEFLSQSLV